MTLKLLGAVCVVIGCGSCGFLMAAQYRANIHMLRDLITVLDYMHCELTYRGTPLPDLCRGAAEQISGRIRKIFHMLAEELDAQIAPNVQRCMASVLARMDPGSPLLYTILLELGTNLGRFDLSGQIRLLESTRALCREHIGKLQEGKEGRLRGYQTLGLCAGAALVILFV